MQFTIKIYGRMNFDEFLSDIITYDLTTIASVNCYNLDMLLNIVRRHIPNHNYYLIENAQTLDIIFKKIKYCDEKIIILNIQGVSNKHLIEYRYKGLNIDKIIIFFIETYKTYDGINIPRTLLYQSDSVYILDKYTLENIKHRFRYSNLKLEIKNILRYYKLKQLLKT